MFNGYGLNLGIMLIFFVRLIGSVDEHQVYTWKKTKWWTFGLNHLCESGETVKTLPKFQHVINHLVVATEIPFTVSYQGKSWLEENLLFELL